MSLWAIFMLALKSLWLVLPVLGAAAYLTWYERRLIAFMHHRVGPNRVGWQGLLQPLADAVKVMFKEIPIPDKAHKALFLLAPVLVMAPSLAAWSLIPWGFSEAYAPVSMGVLVFLAMTSMSSYGIILAGWASNSKYAFLGALRASAQVISYEIAMGMCFITVIMSAGSLTLQDIVMAQSGSIVHWYIWPLFPMAVIYWISAVAETNRAPFDVAEGESEIVAGFHVEYGGLAFALFFLAEYANMVLVSTIAALMFLGGWLNPFQGTGWTLLEALPGPLWMALKTGLCVSSLIWFRATFPRFRYDQIMHLGWKVLIPLTFVGFFYVIVLIQWQIGPWYAA